MYLFIMRKTIHTSCLIAVGIIIGNGLSQPKDAGIINKHTAHLPRDHYKKELHIQKISTTLDRLIRLHREKKNLSLYINQTQLKYQNDCITVTLLPKSGQTTDQIPDDQLKQFGVIIEAKAKHSMRIQVPIHQLEPLITQVKKIGYIREPIRPEPDVFISEGVELMNADHWQNRGYRGEGVRVGVIDLGFQLLSAAQANGDLPLNINTQDFTENGLETEYSHGTAVAEAIYDLVPSADFYLYKISDITDLENAKELCIDQGVQIINHSVSWFLADGYYDGTGRVCDIVQDGIDHKIIWVNSAGNKALDHYRGFFSPDTGNYHLFASGYNINPIGPDPDHGWLHDIGDEIEIALNWNDYPTTSQDYDLHLFYYDPVNQLWEWIASSSYPQNGNTPPEEYIRLINTIQDGIYGVAVSKATATINVDFTLFSLGESFGFYNSEYSVADPASVTDVIAVGAINRLNYDTGPQEYFSSQGPTTDGRPKPDIAAPDNCISFTYDYWFGTSLASPHVAGVCAILKSRFGAFGAEQIKSFLFSNCTVDLSPPGRDNYYGWGKLVMPDITPITVTSPNGGETWKVGSTQNINWIAMGVDEVSLEYSIDGGLSWQAIISSTSAPVESYSWYLPYTPSSNCLIRITDVSNPSIFDISDSPFSIFQPSIAITSPNGDENWKIGSEQKIRWSVQFVDSIKLEYSINNGSSWHEIISKIAAFKRNHVWVTPDTPSTECLIRASDISDPNVNDLSDNTFSLFQPTVTVNTPNGGETWRIGTDQEITWSSDRVDSIRMDYSTNNGSSWKEINRHVPDSNKTYVWTIPNTPSSNCLVRISDAAALNIYDISNNPFVIYTPSVTLLHPKQGEDLKVTEVYNITWESSYVDHVKLEYSIDAGNSWLEICSSTPAVSGFYAWTVPNTVSSSCKLRITDTTDPTIFDLNNQVFTISHIMPDITNLSVIQLNPVSALLNGSVNPKGLPTEIRFKYGLNILYGYEVTANPENVEGSEFLNVQALIDTLIPDTTYHFCIIAQNQYTEHVSEDMIFQTIPVYYPNTLNLQTTFQFPTHNRLTEYKTNDYKLIGLPGGSNLPFPLVLGSQPEENWQAYWDNGNSNNYLNPYSENSKEFIFCAGRAFWLVHKGPLSINQDVLPEPLNKIYQAEIPLHQGWNLITNPFTIAIPWSEVLDANHHENLLDPIWSYSNGFHQAVEFEPYKGYYFDNRYGLLKLKIPYLATISKRCQSPVLFDWTLHIKLLSDPWIDESTFLGVSPLAESGLDPLDFRKPRTISEIPSVYFTHPNWNDNTQFFATDIRKEINEIEKFHFEISAEIDRNIQLLFSQAGMIPPEYDIVLINQTSSRYFNLKEDSIYTFRSWKKMTDFIILIGNSTTIASELSSLKPFSFRLGCNQPNPFNSYTIIPIEIPTHTQIGLAVYNQLGQKIKTIYHGEILAGRYGFSWAGDDRNGNPVSSGLYVVSLNSSSGYHKSVKILLIK